MLPPTLPVYIAIITRARPSGPRTSMRRHAELLLILEEALALVTDFDELEQSSPDISTTACHII
jgi:hypothetical protein